MIKVNSPRVNAINPHEINFIKGLMIANNGLEKACKLSKEVELGVNLYLGKCVYKTVAEDLDIEYTPLESVLE